MWHCSRFIKLGKEALLVRDKNKRDPNLGKKSKEGNLSIVIYYTFSV